MYKMNYHTILLIFFGGGGGGLIGEGRLFRKFYFFGGALIREWALIISFTGRFCHSSSIGNLRIFT